MREGTVVVLADGVIGTVVGEVQEDSGKKLQVLTKNGFVRNVSPSEAFPYQEGLVSQEDNDVGSSCKVQAAPSKRKGSK